MITGFGELLPVQRPSDYELRCNTSGMFPSQTAMSISILQVLPPPSYLENTVRYLLFCRRHANIRFEDTLSSLT